MTRSTNEWMNVSFEVSNQVHYVVMEPYGWMDFCAELGGFIVVVSLVCSVLLALMNFNKLENAIVAQLYKRKQAIKLSAGDEPDPTKDKR